ncbi:MAG: efflux RND transporter periplasmic adaptor subunit [Acidobacteriota bacterium]|nr:efflux RND transporter periplasmic adaptor subunit [Acidobacteriota bacterium]
MISRNTLKLITLAFAPAALSLFALSCGGSKAQSNSKEVSAAATTPQAVEVTTAKPVTRDLPRFLEATGSLAAEEQTDVAPAVGGKVVAVGVDLGSFVQRGAVLVRLDDRDARIRLEQATAQVAQSEAAVRQAEARIGIRPGQTFVPEQVPDVRAARVALELAEKQLRRFERLVETGDVSRSAFDQQKAQRDQLQQQYDVALEQARQNYAAIETARASVAAARTQIESARKAIADAVVVAPISGYVSDRPADVGEYVTTSSKIATIVRTNPLRANIDVPEQEITAIRVGQSVSASVSAYPDRAFSGYVHHVAPGVTPNSRTMTVEAQIENNEGLLKPGQFATVRILMPQSTPALLVPQRAVRTEAGTSYVFVIKNGRAEKRIVQLGQTDGDMVEIKTGLSAEDPVATGNVELLNDGTPVKQ